MQYRCFLAESFHDSGGLATAHEASFCDSSNGDRPDFSAMFDVRAQLYTYFRKYEGTWTAVHVQYGSVGHGDRTNSLTVVQYEVLSYFRKYFRKYTYWNVPSYESLFSKVLSYFGSTVRVSCFNNNFVVVYTYVYCTTSVPSYHTSGNTIMKVMFHTEVLSYFRTKVRKYFRTVAYEGNTNVYQTTCTCTVAMIRR